MRGGNEWILGAAGVMALTLAACDSDSGGTGDNGAPSSWTCDVQHADWERCHDGVIQWCHDVFGMETHFHNGMNCAAHGYECVEPELGHAVCVDPASVCDEGAFRCGAEGTAEANTAFNCLDGRWAIERCGTARECHEEDDEAHCELGDGHDDHDNDHDDQDH